MSFLPSSRWLASISQLKTNAFAQPIPVRSLSLGHWLLLLLPRSNDRPEATMTNMSDKTISRILLVLIPLSLWMALPRYISHLTTFSDVATPEDLLHRPPALTETPDGASRR